jgi:acyl-CoA synthetase (NDP forming)
VSETLVEQLDHIFKPKSIAIIGASNNPGKWGGRMMVQALASNFRGRIYPINPKAKEIFGLTAYADVLDVPDDIEMAVFTIPAAFVPAALKSCIKKGIKAGVIISADFAETGEEGKKLEQETVKIAREGGFRFVGPNGNGIWTSAVGLNIAPNRNLLPGPLAFISQSGTFGNVAGQSALSRGYGLSKIVSMGNQADLTMADYLEYLAQDKDTRVIGIYVEGFKDGRRFFNVAREISKVKPILITKGGSTRFGARATLSHTASIAGEDGIFDAMCRQAGIIRVSQIEHIFIMAEALFSQPLPRGNRIAVIGTGGQGVTTVDFLGLNGLEVPEFTEEDKAGLKRMMAAHAPVPRNPVDFASGGLGPMQTIGVIEKVASFDYIDGIITNMPKVREFSGGSVTEQQKAAIEAMDVFSSIPEKYGKPVITLGNELPESALEILRGARIPMYDTPADCALAMTALVKYSIIKNRK